MNITPEHTRALDTAKFSLYETREDSAFLGALMCNLDIRWDDAAPTAYTDGVILGINPDWFLALPEATRSTVLQHELWHVGYLHPIRAKGLEDWRFNKAADYAINNRLQDEGNTFDGTKPLIDQRYRRMTAEEIYDLLPPDPPNGGPGKSGGGCWSDDPGDRDIHHHELTSDQEAEIITVVQAAVIAQERTGHCSKEVEAISERIRTLNKPKVNWKAEMQAFCSDKARAGLDYTRRNRRYRHVILPARGKRGRLTELAFFMDVSGSVTKTMVEQMMAEVRFIWETLKPKKLHIIQFDTSIRKVESWTEGKVATEIEIIGRGGTSLEPVAKWLENHPINGAVIMSDLECDVMREVKGVPILWLCVNSPTAVVNQGRIIHIEV